MITYACCLETTDQLGILDDTFFVLLIDPMRDERLPRDHHFAVIARLGQNLKRPLVCMICKG